MEVQVEGEGGGEVEGILVVGLQVVELETRYIVEAIEEGGRAGWEPRRRDKDKFEETAKWKDLVRVWL